MNRIEQKFKALKREKRKAFIAFITAGYPDLGITRKLVLEFDRIGVDIVELGVPFSDPLADGPIIQEASQKALEKKAHLVDILKLVKSVRKAGSNIPICLMTYYNPVFCFGDKKFAKIAKESGVDGVIIPDLPPEEGGRFSAYARKSGIDVICFISPTTCAKRIKFIAHKATGFIYYVSLTGVTGPRKRLPSDLIKNLKLIKRCTLKPVCVGFGISTARQVKQLSGFCDGIIVGSAIVQKIKENAGKPGLVKKVSAFVKHLKNV